LLPENERQYRALGQVPLADRALLWQQALEASNGDQPTPEDIARQIAERIANRMAGMSDEEQLKVIENYQDGIPDSTPEPKSPSELNWLLLERKILAVEPIDAEDAEDINEVRLRMHRCWLRRRA
jgi:hypothetical protein